MTRITCCNGFEIDEKGIAVYFLRTTKSVQHLQIRQKGIRLEFFLLFFNGMGIKRGGLGDLVLSFFALASFLHSFCFIFWAYPFLHPYVFWGRRGWMGWEGMR